VITATAKSDGSTHATATVLVTDWFLAENGATKGVQIVTSKGTLVSTISTVACGWSSFAPDHLSYACLNANYSGFGIYTITVTSTNGTVSVGATGTGSIEFVSNFNDVVDPAYSPDGTQIVFVGEINAAQGVYTVGVNPKTVEKELVNEPLANKREFLSRSRTSQQMEPKSFPERGHGQWGLRTTNLENERYRRERSAGCDFLTERRFLPDARRSVPDVRDS
jgi:hypothetical protein